MNFAQIFMNDSCATRIHQAAESAPLSNDTIQRISTCMNDISARVIEYFKTSLRTSIVFNKSCDNTSQPQLRLYGCYICGNAIAEELLKLMTDLETRGVDIYEIVNIILIEKVVECDSNGAPAMIRNIIGFKGLLLADHHTQTSTGFKGLVSRVR